MEGEGVSAIACVAIGLVKSRP